MRIETEPALRLDEAAQAFERDGFVVLERCLDPDRVEVARQLCEQTARRRNRLRCPVPYELLHRWPLGGIVRGTVAWPLLQRLLGSQAATGEFCWFRICPPGGRSVKRVHRDRLRTKAVRKEAPVGISVDVMLTDFTEDNGATEIWCGSPTGCETEPDEIRAAVAEALRAPPRRITGSAGAIVLRDHRALHRGGVNTTASPRCMFSSPGWMAADLLA